ncbi:MAG TPA: DUF6600 domain-containing protein [Candidatus Acidoferrales bacterium]|nr:DUF6600 domain-containing protein [Candidatus Acidoferrales bacterium]
MRKKSLFYPALILFSLFAFVFASSAWADDDPPGRVARLNYIQGSISFQPGGESDWVQASPNRPLTTGDNLWADRDSRGELHIGSSSIRIGSETGITFLNLDDRTVQIQLAEGSLNVNVRRLDGGDDFEIDTPNLAFTLDRPGDYRVDVEPDGNATVITVRSGEGEATGGGSEFHMDSNDRATFSGTDSLNYDGGVARGFDDFDRWCNSRDDREEHSQSARYVSRDVPGYDDLDDNGEWRNDPNYGNVWFPTRVAVGWAPYRYGHWAWVAPWGWTWVEDEPWGFAPFHYGRWAEVGDRWCWVPGPMVVRPVYAPALVVFVGGPRFGMSVAFGGGGGGVGWFPLGPREVYVPPYRTSERYVQRVNVTNTTVNVVNVTNVYNNRTENNVTYMHQHNAGAVTAVSHDTFVNSRAVAGSNVRVNQQQMQTAEVQRNFAVAPVQRSVVGASAPAAVRPPAAVMSRQVVVKETPAPVRPSFNNTAPQQNRTFRQAGAPPVQQQQRQQQGQQQRPGQFPQQGQQQPQTRQQMTNQPPQQPEMQQHQQTISPPQQQQAQPQFPARQNQQSGQPQQPQMQQRPQTSTPPQQEQQRPQQQFPSRQNQQQPADQQHQQQMRQPPEQQQQRPQTNQNNNPPAEQRPPVRFAPPARTNEDTYHPHQFEHPQNAAPPAAAAPPAQAPKELPKPQERGQDSKKQPDPKDNKK